MSTLEQSHNPHNPQHFDGIATHPELNRIVIKQKIDAPYVVWLALRQAVIRDGLSGHFKLSEAYQYGKEAGLFFTRKHWNRIIQAGNGIFWGTDGKRVFLRSFDRVYKLLADDDCISVRNPQFINITLYKSGVARKAELYWSWFASRQEQTISRATITELFALSGDQQRSYESFLGPRLIIHTNYVHVDYDLYKHQMKNIPNYAYSFIQERFTDNKIETINVIAYQLPNTFIASQKHSGVSPVAKAANRAINAITRLYRHTLACGNSWRYLRLYFAFYDEWEKKGMPIAAFVRTYFQGKKHIYRLGQLF